MPKSPLDDLPPADPKAFRRAIKRNLEKALQSLAKFSDSVRDGRAPDWPPAATYALFMAQLRAFRFISKRKENAPAIQLMHEIDRTWHKLQVVATVESCIEYMQRYIGHSLLRFAIAKAQFKRQNVLKDPLVSLVYKSRLATSEDLGVMRDLLPEAFQQLDTLASGEFVKQATGAFGDAFKKLRTAVALSAQEYLFSEHLRFLERYAAAKRLREFIFDLKCRPYTKKLFGFSEVQINEWKEIDRLEAKRVRQARFRQNERKKRHSSR